MKSVLLTRIFEANQETIEEINKYNLNFRYIECPLIKYETLDFDSVINSAPFTYKNLRVEPIIIGGTTSDIVSEFKSIDYNILKNYSNIIITSKYAATIIAKYELKHNVWVVGNISKELLNNKGLKVVYTAKNVDDLITHFPADLYEYTIYISSNEITKALPDKIARHIIYNVKYLNELPLSVIKEFKNSIDFVLLYSQNSAKILVKLLRQNNLLEYLQNSLVVAISAKVANIVRPFTKNVVYCDDQNPNDIIKLLFENSKIQ